MGFIPMFKKEIVDKWDRLLLGIKLQVKKKKIKKRWIFYIDIIGRKVYCIPESFNTNISHQLFDYTLTFLNSQH